jgi:hypothetical protein
MGNEITTDRYADTGYSVKDTPPEINRLMFERFMSLSCERRMLMGLSMLGTARQMILDSLPTEFTAIERKLALFQRLYGFPFPGELSPTT